MNYVYKFLYHVLPTISLYLPLLCSLIPLAYPNLFVIFSLLL